MTLILALAVCSHTSTAPRKATGETTRKRPRPWRPAPGSPTSEAAVAAAAARPRPLLQATGGLKADHCFLRDEIDHDHFLHYSASLSLSLSFPSPWPRIKWSKSLAELLRSSDITPEAKIIWNDVYSSTCRHRVRIHVPRDEELAVRTPSMKSTLPSYIVHVCAAVVLLVVTD